MALSQIKFLQMLFLLFLKDILLTDQTRIVHALVGFLITQTQ